MPDYRLYIYSDDGRPLGPGMPINAEDDDAALAIAIQNYVDGLDWTLCDGIRIVKNVKRQK